VYTITDNNIKRSLKPQRVPQVESSNRRKGRKEYGKEEKTMSIQRIRG